MSTENDSTQAIAADIEAALRNLLAACDKANASAIERFQGVVVDIEPIARARYVLERTVSFCGGWQNIFEKFGTEHRSLEWDETQEPAATVNEDLTVATPAQVPVVVPGGVEHEALTIREATLDELVAMQTVCVCGDRLKAMCPGEWEPGCDLGNNEKHARGHTPTPEERAATQRALGSGGPSVSRSTWTPDAREELRQKICAELDVRLPRVKRHFNDWHGWPGTWAFADCAVSVFAEAYPNAERTIDDDGATDAALRDMEARKDAAYLERNQVVAALAKCFPSGVGRTAIEGWSEDWHGVVYIDLPTGQASWHHHDSQAYLFADLPPYTKPWDGHTTPEKYERLAAMKPPLDLAGDVSVAELTSISGCKALPIMRAFAAAGRNVTLNQRLQFDDIAYALAEAGSAEDKPTVQHYGACNYSTKPIGSPGCICAVVNKNELRAQNWTDRGGGVWAPPPEESVLLEALESIRQYGADTLSGRVDAPADLAWYRDSVREMTRRARMALPAPKEDGDDA